jgi:hypothetical protein
MLAGVDKLAIQFPTELRLNYLNYDHFLASSFVGGALVNSLKNESCPNCFKFYRWLGVYSNKMNPKFCEKKMLGSALMGASKVISSILTSDSLMTHCILAHSLVLATVL